jgi:hypothetical protein
MAGSAEGGQAVGIPNLIVTLHQHIYLEGVFLQGLNVYSAHFFVQPIKTSYVIRCKHYIASYKFTHPSPIPGSGFHCSNQIKH